MVCKTTGSSLFDAAAEALEWVEVDCQAFGTARRFRDDQALLIGAGSLVQVRIGRIRLSIREPASTNREGNRR